MIKFPYAIREFEKIIAGGYLYLDRTNHIPFIEEWGYELFFLRPRRFGKSLWLSTLMTYYDVAHENDFERLFGNLAIGQNPTPLHNQYMVMQWDFSEISAQGSVEKIEKRINGYLNECIAIFLNKYRGLVRSEVRIDAGNALLSFKSLAAAVNLSPHKLYLFIDEYDNFGNEVFMQPVEKLVNPDWAQKSEAQQQKYTDLVTGEGIFKTLFKSMKSAGSGGGLDRVFMTGVSPIVLSDVTSGANTFKDLTWRPNLNDLCGFNEAEVEGMLTAVIQGCGLSEKPDLAEEMLGQMRSFYDGSRFVTHMPHQNIQDIPRVYNPTLTFYFLEEFQEMCAYPEEMLDGNLEPDSNKLAYITEHKQGKPLLMDALQGAGYGLEHEAVQGFVTVSTLRRRFGMKDLLKDDQQRENMAILLTYLGALTVSGRTPSGSIRLAVPNLVMRRLYADRALQMMTNEDSSLLTQSLAAAEMLFERAALQPLCTFVEDHLLSVFDNRDYREFDELTLKTLFISMLYYKSTYVMESEPEIIQQYGDLLMMLRPGMRDMGLFDFLFEFKFLKLSQVQIDKKALTGEQVKQKSKTELLAIDAVKTEMDSAKKQLIGYRQSLQQKYGAALKLRAFAAVGIGLKRVLWEEI